MVAVPGDPADVRGTPVHGVRLDVEDVVVRRRHPHQVSRSSVHDPFRTGRRTAGVHQEQQIFGVHLRARAGLRVVAEFRVRLVVPHIAAVHDGHVTTRPADDEAGLHAGRGGHRLVGRGLQRDRLAAPGVGEAHHLALQVRVCDVAPLADRFTLPVVSDPVIVSGFDVPVDAVVTDVERPAEVPAGVRRLPLLQRLERPEPADPVAALPRPEFVRVLVVEARPGVRLRGERG
jgi:hypothetical protein